MHFCLENKECVHVKGIYHVVSHLTYKDGCKRQIHCSTIINCWQSGSEHVLVLLISIMFTHTFFLCLQPLPEFVTSSVWTLSVTFSACLKSRSWAQTDKWTDSQADQNEVELGGRGGVCGESSGCVGTNNVWQSWDGVFVFCPLTRSSRGDFMWDCGAGVGMSVEVSVIPRAHTRTHTHTSIQKQPWDIVRLRAGSRKPNVFMSDKTPS